MTQPGIEPKSPRPLGEHSTPLGQSALEIPASITTQKNSSMSAQKNCKYENAMNTVTWPLCLNNPWWFDMPLKSTNTRSREYSYMVKI